MEYASLPMPFRGRKCARFTKPGLVGALPREMYTMSDLGEAPSTGDEIDDAQTR
jgi:hypothetical protein